MRRLCLLLLVLLVSLGAPAQDILLNRLYQLEGTQSCTLTACVNPRQRMTLRVNGSTLQGDLVVNKYQPHSYNFYVKKRLMFVVVFGKDEQGDNLLIANQDYLKFFRPCDDQKIFLLHATGS